jgi:surface protein
MKKLYFLFIFFTVFANAQAPFISTWEVQGETEYDLTIRIPVEYNFTNSYTIDFGDGTILTNQVVFVQHTYAAPGIYTVSMSGDFKRLNFTSPYSSPLKLKTIEQWGDIEWTTMHSAFYGCINLTINAIDAPDLSHVTDMSSMFSEATSFNQSINHWDVSNVTNMESLFSGADAFNQPLDNWDVSNVIYMRNMFDDAISFNQPLNSWDVSSVTTMAGMFSSAIVFNQPLDNWNVSNVTDLRGMFSNSHEGEIAFNQSLDSWDVSNVTDVSGMFYKATSFNQPLNNWNVSNVTDMGGMFTMATSFNQPLDNWNVSNVTNMLGLFDHAISFNQPLNSWNVSNVTNMEQMFLQANSFNQPLNNWNISNVTEMTDILFYAISFNQDISSWDFSNTSAYSSPGQAIGFVAASGLDANNYDALLFKFAQLGIENQNFWGFGLKYCDYGVRDFLINNLGWTITEDSLEESCVGNHLVGNVRFDLNGNGCDTTDIPAKFFLINAGNDTGNYTTSLDTAGAYTLKVFENTYSLSLLNVPDYFTVVPTTNTVSFTGFGGNQTLDFCLTASEEVQDLNITLLPINQARPGFETNYQLVVQNMGTQTVSGAQVNLTYDSLKQSFVSAGQVPASASQGQLSFNMASIQPFETKVVNLVMQTLHRLR